jgi:hypothetical protein
VNQDLMRVGRIFTNAVDAKTQVFKVVPGGDENAEQDAEKTCLPIDASKRAGI